MTPAAGIDPGSSARKSQTLPVNHRNIQLQISAYFATIFVHEYVSGNQTAKLKHAKCIKVQFNVKWTCVSIVSTWFFIYMVTHHSIPKHDVLTLHNKVYKIEKHFSILKLFFLKLKPYSFNTLLLAYHLSTKLCTILGISEFL